jgi:hypothetical protein
MDCSAQTSTARVDVESENGFAKNHSLQEPSSIHESKADDASSVDEKPEPNEILNEHDGDCIVFQANGDGFLMHLTLLVFLKRLGGQILRELDEVIQSERGNDEETLFRKVRCALTVLQGDERIQSREPRRVYIYEY